jgi:hypothetical protein
VVHHLAEALVAEVLEEALEVEASEVVVLLAAGDVSIQ